MVLTHHEASKMKLFLVAFAVVAAVSAFEPIETDYHNKIGIPRAETIKAAEAALDFDGSRITGGVHSSLGAHPHLVLFLLLV